MCSIKEYLDDMDENEMYDRWREEQYEEELRYHDEYLRDFYESI